MVSHADYADLLKRVQRAITTASAFRGTLYRACDPTYANTRDLLTGEGSRKAGGRWNGPGTFATVYLAQSVEGSIAESLGLPGVFGFDPTKRLPLTLVAVESRLEVVLDFTDPRVRRVVGVTIAEMNACDWRGENASGNESITQAMGRAAFESGMHGILVPSAVKRTFRNLNVFPANLRTTGGLKIIAADKLPPPPAPGVV
jgi:RES domain-containing protein